MPSKFSHPTVADPGFSPGGAPTPKIAIIFHIFTENCIKMKEFGPPGGACVPGAPPWIHQCPSTRSLKGSMDTLHWTVTYFNCLLRVCVRHYIIMLNMNISFHYRKKEIGDNTSVFQKKWKIFGGGSAKHVGAQNNRFLWKDYFDAITFQTVKIIGIVNFVIILTIRNEVVKVRLS